MSSKRALLIDMDGTLVDTAGANFLAYSIVLAQVGIKITKKDFENMAFGKNWKQFLPALLLAHKVEISPQEISSKKMEKYAEMMDMITVNVALVKLLESTRQLFSTALVTSASAINVSNVLTFHNLSHLFDVIVTGEDVTRHKPHPEGYIIAAKRLAVTPGQCIIFEDSEVGVASARAFGADVIAVKMIS